jgi:uncharacterized protein YoxC
MANVSGEHLEARVRFLETEVEGEKLVTRHILEQTRRNADDLAAVKTRLDRVERKVDGVAQDVGNVRRTVEGLARELPKIVTDALRAVRTRGRKS